MTVPVYRVVPAEDTGPVRTLVDLVADRVSDAVTFTSAPAVAAFLDVADEADRLPTCSTPCATTSWPPASAR